jgi:hypothetical protein
VARIDEPFDQLEGQNPGSGLAVPVVTLNVLTPLVALLNPGVGTAAALLSYVSNIWSDAQRAARLEALQSGLIEKVGDLQKAQQLLEKKLANIDAQDTVATALREAMFTARLDKARMFGQVLGETLASDEPNWREAAEFIATIEGFNDDDWEALRVLWSVQKGCWHGTGGIGISEVRSMSMKANDYTSTWGKVLERAATVGISKDDWYSRCARLSGFGLAIMVPPNQNDQGPDAICYRMTGRTVRLLELVLGFSRMANDELGTALDLSSRSYTTPWGDA